MIEFHVDDYDFLHDLAAERRFKYGGNLSVQMPAGVHPLIILGDDECDFAQYLLGSKQWVGPKGERALLPKTDRLSLMLSAFQCCEFRFGLDISQAKLDEINFMRLNKKYVDEEAGIAVHGTAVKKPLEKSQFVIFFELGINNDGYWTYNHMACQFEDCIDCLETLYPQFDFCFTFDHSQGHAKKRASGLDASAMNFGYGGVQPAMDPSIIKEEEGYLGVFDHPAKLKKGNVQHFIFCPPNPGKNFPGDVGPWWMDDNERE
jgi:hypothetical protein